MIKIQKTGDALDGRTGRLVRHMGSLVEVSVAGLYYLFNCNEILYLN